MGDIYEMEKDIGLKAADWTRKYTTLFLLIWSLYDYIHIRNIGLPFLLLVSRGVISDGVQVILKWRIKKNEK